MGVRSSQWRKWRRAGEDHGRAGLLDRVDHVLVASRAARLDDRGGAGVERDARPVGEREERVGGERGARERRARTTPPSRPRSSRRRRGSSARRRCRSSARSFTRTIAFDETCLHTRHAKTRSPHCALVGGAGDDLPAFAVLDVGVRVLHEQAAEHALVVARVDVAPALAVDEDARVLLLAEARRARRRCSRVRTAPRRTGPRASRRARPSTSRLSDDDAPVRRGRVGGERLRRTPPRASRRSRRRTGSRA